MEKKKKKRKWKDVRSALVMVLVMAAMLSTATYAWFTLSSSPTVAGMQMVATSTSGLTVGKAVDGSFYNAIELETPTDVDNINLPAGAKAGDLLKLVPVALKSGTGFVEATYDASTGKVTGLSSTAITEMVGNVAVYTYYIKSDNGEVNVGIITGDSAATTELTVENNQAKTDGTMVRRKMDATDPTQGAGNASENATYATRIGLIVGDNTTDWANMIILEPNNDGITDNTQLNAANTMADSVTLASTASDVATKVSFQKNGMITEGKTTDYTSASLFTVGESPTKVTMYIWLEGADEQCVDEIKSDQLEAQIQFTVVE